MKRILSLVALFALALVLAGCGGTSTYEIEKRAENDAQPPDWYPDPEPDDDFIFAAKSTLSVDIQTAIDKATIKGRDEIGKQLQLELSSIESLLEKETGFKQDAKLETAYKSATKIATEKSLVGSRIKDKHLVREGDMWRAYILMEMPLAPMKEALVDAVKSSPELYKKLGSTEAFKEIGG